MSAYNCLKAKAAAGVVSKHKGAAALRRINEIREALVKQGEPLATAQTMAELRFAEEAKHAATNQKWRLINRVRVTRAIDAKVAATAPKDLGRMAIKTVDDLDFDARSEHKRIMGKVGEFLEKHRVTVLGGVSNPASFKDFLKALKGEATTDANAKALAAAVNDVNEWIRKKLNSYGHSIGKMENWGLPHKHSPLAISGVPFRTWADDIDAELDWAGMINPKTGLEFMSVPPQAFRDEFLKEARANILYGKGSKNPKWGESGNGNALELHRVFKFKTVDGWVKYNNKYGAADPHSTLLNHWDHMAKEIALSRRLGPEAETAVDYMGQAITKKMREADAGFIQTKKAESGVILAKRMTRVMGPGVGPGGWLGSRSATFFSTTRKVLTSALLDRASVISIPSDMNSASIASLALGQNPGGWFNTYTGLMADATGKGSGKTRQELLVTQHIAESWANPGVTSARYQEEYPAAAWAEKMSNAAMRIQGLTAATDSGKLAMNVALTGWMGRDKDLSLSQINPLMQKAMREAGITDRDWDIFRAGPIHTAPNGALMLDPLVWHMTSTIDPVEADRIFLTFQSFIEKWVERAVPTQSLIARGVLDPKAYGLAPGGLLYEGLKSAGMFKSFVAAFTINQARMIGHMPTIGHKAAYITGVIGSTTLVGALAYQVGDLLLGRDPQDMTKASFWWRSMLRGGGLGPAGDLLATGSTSWGGGLPGYVAGPIPGVAQDIGELSFGNVIQAYNQAVDGDDIDLDFMKELMDFQRRYTPMWQTPLAAGGSALDRLISDQLVLLLDPGALEAMAKAAKARDNRTGGGTAWMPGSPIPNRMPDFGNAIGL